MNLPLWALGLVLAAPPLRVGVVPPSGSAEQALLTSSEINKTLDALPDLDRVDLSRLDAIEGPGAQARLTACAGKLVCIQRATSAVRTDKLLLSRIDESGGLTLSLVPSSSTSTELPRDVLVELAGSIEDQSRVIRRSVLRLFPERAKRAQGIVRLSGIPEGAKVLVDGNEIAGVGVGSSQLNMPPGPHVIRVEAPGRDAFEQNVNVDIGVPKSVQVILPKNRSPGPYILGGSALVLAGIAGVVGLSVEGQADDWKEACRVGASCDAGFTRQRYLAAQDEVSRGRIATNVMLGTAVAAAIGSVVWYFLDPGSDGS